MLIKLIPWNSLLNLVETISDDKDTLKRAAAEQNGGL